MRSAHPPERLATEVQSRLGPALAAKGYCVVGHGTAGVTWRREVSGRLIAGLLLLGAFALGLLGGATVGAVLLGILCLVAGSGVLYARRPASVTVNFARVAGGTEISVISSADAAAVTEILQALVSSTRAVAATSAPLAPSACDACGAQVSGNFCADCGKARTRTCAGCEQVGLTSDFCPNCGSATYESP